MPIRRIQLKDISGAPTANQAGQTTLQIKPGNGLRILSIEAVCIVTGVTGAVTCATETHYCQ